MTSHLSVPTFTVNITTTDAITWCLQIYCRQCSESVFSKFIWMLVGFFFDTIFHHLFNDYFNSHNCVMTMLYYLMTYLFGHKNCVTKSTHREICNHQHLRKKLEYRNKSFLNDVIHHVRLMCVPCMCVSLFWVLWGRRETGSNVRPQPRCQRTATSASHTRYSPADTKKNTSLSYKWLNCICTYLKVPG